MAGDLSFPISSIIDFVLAAASLVSPPFLGIQSKVYPHVHLKELGVLAAETSYIAGVTNPTFLMQKQLYDISCQVDVGKLTINRTENELPYDQEPYYKADMDFIDSLIYRIKQSSINDIDLRQAFGSYTRLMIDIASGSASGLKHQGVELGTLYANRARRLRQTQMYRVKEACDKLSQIDYVNGVSSLTIEKHLNQLKYCHDFSRVGEVNVLKTILGDLVKYL